MLRGLKSALGVLGVPLGSWWCGDISALASDERKERGCVFVLPGIEGRGWLNIEVARGIADGGWTGAVEVFDWTTGYPLLLLYHLFALRRNRDKAARLADRIGDYQSRHPGRPVHLVGHSAGAAVAVFALEALGAGQVTSAVLLGPALSPGYDLRPALRRVERGVWNFSSVYDWAFLRLGTTVFGTADRVHGGAAGAVGFRPREALDEGKLHEVRYEWAMARSWNFGGHHGCTNREFVARWVAPLLAR